MINESREMFRAVIQGSQDGPYTWSSHNDHICSAVLVGHLAWKVVMCCICRVHALTPLSFLSCRADNTSIMVIHLRNSIESRGTFYAASPWFFISEDEAFSTTTPSTRAHFYADAEFIYKCCKPPFQ